MRKRKNHEDFTGRLFGRWEVIGIGEDFVDRSGRHYKTWRCRCTCPAHTEKDIYEQHLIHGNSKSCGCLLKETTGNNFRTHGKTDTRLYRIWCEMKRRCNSPSSPVFDRYGGRGITICQEWNDSFSTFETWALNNGYAENLSIDRIDNNKGYYPENCRWADYKTQANNRRTNVNVTIDGVTHTASEWSDITGIPAYEMCFRMRHGWDSRKAVFTPLIKRGKAIHEDMQN